ncbi:hypothetical protein [Winogradskyella sp. 3972H.M.0a.05]|uniref:hypothetical protein n=1 Tax=Winogradskyella sp. 3972H.M.0a.05 TaxID=2950277 RepID=UPI0033914238
MKFNLTPFILGLITLFSFSCSSDDSSNDPSDPPTEIQRFIESITVVSAQDPAENTTINVTYDTDGKVTSVTDGVDTNLFIYDNGALSNITGGGDNLNVLELYDTPQDAFEFGEVTQYDNNGNPVQLTLLDEEYDWNTNSYTTVVYTAEISYDNKPNPYFYTLDAAGIIDALDNIELNFSSDVQNPQLVQARMLLPANNPSMITIKDADNVTTHTVNFDYVYNADDYPTSASVTATDVMDNSTSIYTATYTYRQ